MRAVIAIQLIFFAGAAATSQGLAMESARPSRYAPPRVERIVIVDPSYIPGNPRCYLQRQIVDTPHGPAVAYRQVCN